MSIEIKIEIKEELIINEEVYEDGDASNEVEPSFEHHTCIICKIDYIKLDENEMVPYCHSCYKTLREKKYEKWLNCKKRELESCLGCLNSFQSMTSYTHDCTLDNVFVCNNCHKMYFCKLNIISHLECCNKTLNSKLSVEKEKTAEEKAIITPPKKSECEYKNTRLGKKNKTTLSEKDYGLSESVLKRCKHCYKIFATKSSLHVHIRTHFKERNFKCKHCSKLFSRSDHLNLHVRTHTGEKPHQCNVCKKYFTRSTNLVDHLRIHSNEKPFKCSHCNSSFRRQTNLRDHIRIHTGERPFKCKVCDKSFRRSSNLILHNRIHTGERPYKCPHCTKTFNRSSHVKSHLKTHGSISE